MSVRQKVKQYTKAQFEAMSESQKKKHVADVLREVEAAKALGRTKDLTYLYKALPGDMKTQEMKKRILPFDFSNYKKKPRKK